MSEKQEKKPLQANYWHETFFLPPLKMVLTFLDKEAQPEEKDANAKAENLEIVTEKDVERLIEKLSEKEE
jgi:hypothetical protein